MKEHRLNRTNLPQLVLLQGTLNILNKKVISAVLTNYYVCVALYIPNIFYFGIYPPRKEIVETIGINCPEMANRTSDQKKSTAHQKTKLSKNTVYKL